MRWKLKGFRYETSPGSIVYYRAETAMFRVQIGRWCYGVSLRTEGTDTRLGAEGVAKRRI